MREAKVHGVWKAVRTIMGDALRVEACQFVPFFFKSARRPDFEGFNVTLYSELQEYRLYFRLKMNDFLWVWSSGHYLARSQGSQLNHVAKEDLEPGPTDRNRPRKGNGR